MARVRKKKRRKRREEKQRGRESERNGAEHTEDAICPLNYPSLPLARMRLAYVPLAPSSSHLRSFFVPRTVSLLTTASCSVDVLAATTTTTTTTLLLLLLLLRSIETPRRVHSILFTRYRFATNRETPMVAPMARTRLTSKSFLPTCKHLIVERKRRDRDRPC